MNRQNVSQHKEPRCLARAQQKHLSTQLELEVVTRDFRYFVEHYYNRGFFVNNTNNTECWHKREAAVVMATAASCLETCSGILHPTELDMERLLTLSP